MLCVLFLLKNTHTHTHDTCNPDLLSTPPASSIPARLRSPPPLAFTDGLDVCQEAGTNASFPPHSIWCMQVWQDWLKDACWILFHARWEREWEFPGLYDELVSSSISLGHTWMSWKSGKSLFSSLKSFSGWKFKCLRAVSGRSIG